MTQLAALTCRPCRKESPLLSDEERAELLPQLPEWEIETPEGVARIVRQFSFGDYLAGADFAMAVAQMAEAQGHHPRLILEWGSVTVIWWTHILNGLHSNDFICAAKTDKIYAAYAKVSDGD